MSAHELDKSKENTVLEKRKDQSNRLQDANKALQFDGQVHQYNFLQDNKRVLLYYYSSLRKILTNRLQRFYRIRRLIKWFLYKRGRRLANSSGSSWRLQMPQWIKEWISSPPPRYEYKEIYSSTPTLRTSVLPHADKTWHKLFVKHYQRLLLEGCGADDPKTYILALENATKNLDNWYKLGLIPQAEYKDSKRYIYDLGHRQAWYCKNKQAQKQRYQDLPKHLSKREKILETIKQAKLVSVNKKQHLDEIKAAAAHKIVKEESLTLGQAQESEQKPTLKPRPQAKAVSLDELKRSNQQVPATNPSLSVSPQGLKFNGPAPSSEFTPMASRPASAMPAELDAKSLEYSSGRAQKFNNMNEPAVSKVGLFGQVPWTPSQGPEKKLSDQDPLMPSSYARPQLGKGPGFNSGPQPAPAA